MKENETVIEAMVRLGAEYGRKPTPLDHEQQINDDEFDWYIEQLDYYESRD